MMKIKTLLITLFISTNLSSQHKVSFTSEYIDFKLDENFFSINGIYVFRNNTSEYIQNKIIFPFAAQSSNIDSIRVADITNFSQLKFSNEKNGISFIVNIMPNAETEINIFYRQKTAKENVYILTSTSTWNEPLDLAVYNLSVEKNIDNISFSIVPDSAAESENNKIYKWRKCNFFPDKDFKVIVK